LGVFRHNRLPRNSQQLFSLSRGKLDRTRRRRDIHFSHLLRSLGSQNGIELEGWNNIIAQTNQPISGFTHPQAGRRKGVLSS